MAIDTYTDIYNKTASDAHTTSYDESFSKGAASEHQGRGGSHSGGVYHPSQTPAGKLNQRMYQGVDIDHGSSKSFANTGKQEDVGSGVDEAKDINANKFVAENLVSSAGPYGDVSAPAWPS